MDHKFNLRFAHLNAIKINFPKKTDFFIFFQRKFYLSYDALYLYHSFSIASFRFCIKG